MPEEKVLDLTVDTTNIVKALNSVDELRSDVESKATNLITKSSEELIILEEKRKKLDKELEKTKKKSRETWKLAVGVAQASWNLTTTLLEIQGVQISQTLRAVISGAFAAHAIITPILAAETVTPGMQAAAAFGFAQIALSIAAAFAAEQEATDIESDFRDQASVLGSISSLAGEFRNI